MRPLIHTYVELLGGDDTGGWDGLLGFVSSLFSDVYHIIMAGSIIGLVLTIAIGGVTMITGNFFGREVMAKNKNRLVTAFILAIVLFGFLGIASTVQVVSESTFDTLTNGI